MMLHGPSVAIGAAVSAALVASAFLALGALDLQKTDLVREDAPKPGPDVAFLLESGSVILGDPDAGVTLVEFGDYQCIACSRFFHQTEDALLQSYVETGKVKMFFMDFTIIGQDSANAAHGSHCAADQGKFWEYHDILYNNWAGENTGWASPDNLYRFAGEIDLDLAEWGACMNDARHLDMIQASNEYARAAGLPGTPSFFVIGPQGHVTSIVGPQPYEVFARVFDAELAR